MWMHFQIAVEEMVKERGKGDDNNDKEMIGVENVVVRSKDQQTLLRVTNQTILQVFSAQRDHQQ
jgi:hypothetical protein